MKDEGDLAESPLKLAIVEQVRRFDILALLDVLRLLGYTSRDIEFRSHMSVTPAPLLHAIEFQRSPRMAVITVNAGLLSARSPLPSYLLKLMDEPPEFRFVHFIRFIDHPLLKARFAALAPERDDDLRPQFERRKGSYLKLLNLKTPATLGWLFQQVFPELEVTVRRSMEERSFASRGVQLGAAVLGGGISFGGRAVLATNGIEVRLTAEEPAAGNGRLWATEAMERIRGTIFPRLEDLDFPLRVTLILHDQESWMRIERGSLLGFEPLVKPDRTSRESRLIEASRVV